MVPSKLYGASNINDPGRETWKSKAMISQAFNILTVSNMFATEETAFLAILFCHWKSVPIPEKHSWDASPHFFVPQPLKVYILFHGSIL